jgi:CDP-4-dehydro-6-deoxyglucose reductase
VRVSLSKSARSFSVAPGQSILDSALAAGLNLPHGCKGGNCGACRAHLHRGKVDYPNGPPLGLSDAERSDGLILLCQARAQSDLSIDILEISTADSAVVKRLPSRIERTQALSHDVLGVFLRLPAAELFRFEAGQYIDIILPGGRRRSFSIASPPHDSRLLELHVRRVPGGELTERLFDDARRGTLLTIEGPLGRFVYGHHPTAPMLLIAGGTGFAPLKSIIRHVVENGLDREMLLYWGVRSEQDIYACDDLDQLMRRAPGFRYEIVLSEPGREWSGRRGWVHECVLREVEALDQYDIYASGPPAMVAAVQREFPQHGVDPSRLSFDSFDYAPDTLERQRTMAASKS